MRFRTIAHIVHAFSNLLQILAVFAQPLLPTAAPSTSNHFPENQSLSGQISSVGDAAFSR